MRRLHRIVVAPVALPRGESSESLVDVKEGNTPEGGAGGAGGKESSDDGATMAASGVGQEKDILKDTLEDTLKDTLDSWTAEAAALEGDRGFVNTMIH